MSRSCESCGHFESHEPRTASLSSGRCPKCGCLSGWQAERSDVDKSMDLFADMQRAAVQRAILGVELPAENGGAGSKAQV